MQAFARGRVRTSFIVCLASLSAGLFAMAAHPQGVTATAKPASATAPIDPAALKRRIDELERRVLELEKVKAEEVQWAQEADALEKKFEQRLAAIEAEQQKDNAEATSAKNSSGASDFDPLNIVAPFVIRDQDGTPLLRVDRSPTGNPRLIVGNPLGAQAILGATADGGKLQLMDNTNKVRLSAYSGSSAGASGVMIGAKTGFARLGDNTDGVPVIQILNQSDIPVAQLRLMLSQSGELMIANAAGDKLVRAAVAPNGIGVVKTGPGGLGAAALQGNIALPASEIQGRVR